MKLISIELFKLSKKIGVFILVLGAMIAMAAFFFKTGITQTVIEIGNAQSLPLALRYSTAQFFSIFLAVHLADSITGERANGSVKLMALRPVTRLQILSSKILAAFLMLVILSLAFVLMSYAIGMAFMGWGDHAVFAGTSYSTSEGILLAIKAYGSSILPLMAFGMISAFISVVSSAAPVAIAVSASLSLVGQYLSAIPAARIFSVIHQTYFFSDYFTKSMNVKEAILSAGASLAYILVFYALAAFAFLRKDMP